MCRPRGATKTASDGIGIVARRILENKVGRRWKYHRFRVIEHTFKKDTTEYEIMTMRRTGGSSQSTPSMTCVYLPKSEE
jgi:hypothetical protein